MTKSVGKFFGYALAAVFMGLFVASIFYTRTFIAFGEAFIGGNYLVSAVGLVLLLIVSTVVAPLTLFPVIPAAAPFLGAFPTALLSILGWTIGSTIAFLIARHLGKPVAAQLVSMKHVDALTRSMPAHLEFWWVVLLHAVFPVDLASYALGFISRMSTLRYAVATALGIAPGAFALSYAGAAFIEQSFFLMIGSLAAAGIISLVGYLMLKNHGIR